MRIAAVVLVVQAAVLGCGSTASPDCDCDAAAAACPACDASADPSDKPVNPEPVDTRPDRARCTTFIDHMAVVTAQAYGAPAAGLFTADERDAGIEHCLKYAHSRVLDCAEQTQVSSYLGMCLYLRAVPRPRLDKPTRESCERFRDRSMALGAALQSKVGGYVTPQSAKAQERMVISCLDSMASKQVECGIKATTQLDMWSCFSPYQTGAVAAWPTAEQCEAYGSKMLALLRPTLVARSVDEAQALTVSGLAAYAAVGVQRVQLVNLCHQLAPELSKCHTDAATVVELASCVP